MPRNKIISQLIEYYVEYYTNIGKVEFKDILASGFKGFENYTDKELTEALKNMKEILGEK